MSAFSSNPYVIIFDLILFIILLEYLSSILIIAFAFLDNVLGKSMPITFIVLLNVKGEIINANVIKYREAYGGEVASKIWLSQFIGLNSHSSYKLNQDIDGISGATISVNSLSKGINKITSLFSIIKDELK